jgi:DNA-binding transcriptional LysR family regulator
MLNLRTVDLNLLVAFDALMLERHVTRAASRIGLSQPAMSSALSRLRGLFDDPLLVRTANGMQPTPRAIELMGPVTNALKQVRRVFDAQDKFDPARSCQPFTVRMGDMNVLIFLPAIISELQARAPGITLEIRHLSPTNTIEALESDEVELAVSTGLHHTSSIQSMDLAADEVVLVLRKGHPFLKKKNEAPAFLNLKHIWVSQSPADTRFLDDHLAKLKMRRQIVLTLPHWLAATAVVAETDLVTVASERMTRKLDSRFVTLPLPFAPQRFMWKLYWHRRYKTHAGHRWIRSLISDVSGSGRKSKGSAAR